MQADLEDAAAFAAPISGCKYVIHTASPVIMNPPRGKASLAHLPCMANLSGPLYDSHVDGTHGQGALIKVTPMHRRRSTCCGQL